MADRIQYTLTDEAGHTASFGVDVPDTFTLAQYDEFAAAYAILVDDIVGGIVSKAVLKRSVDIGDLTDNSVGAVSDIEDIGAFSFRTAAFRRVRVNVPGILESLVIPNSKELDLAEPAVAAIITAMQNGIAVTGGTITPSDIQEDDIVGFESALERFRASGRRR
jgi:hypothetical protein